MFLTEQELKETFWKNYNYRKRAQKFQFECPIRSGGADLITIECFQENWQINSFEFKLNDMKKVLLQAQGNLPFVNKSWIVIQEEKSQVVRDKYMNHICESKYIGIITVLQGGKWEILKQPEFQKEIKWNQALLNLIMRGY